MAQIKRTVGVPQKKMPPGPFVAKVISHLDPRRMGTLQVQLLSDIVSGNDKDEPGQLFNARYCTPFYGVNNVQSNGKNQTYQESQQSYGFWAVPPDPGTKVLVIFAEGQANQCYWIGCIQDEYMNYMVPDGRATKDASRIHQDTVPKDYKGMELPVGEYNKKITTATTANPSDFEHPYNPNFTNKLATQGLLEDKIRGLTTSSARRDIPNTVYGWNTPGPLDKRDGAPKGTYGPVGESVQLHRSRLGGSSIVMDDGDPEVFREQAPFEAPSNYRDIGTNPNEIDKVNQEYPFNELTRIRTRTGHQILLHNSEDLIYIGNGRGTAWVELTSNGKIDVYAKDSINFRTETDLNIKADRDINIESGKDIHITAGRNYKLNVNNDRDVKTGKNETTFVGSNKNEWTGDNHVVAVGGDEDIQIKGTQRSTILGDYNLQVNQDGHIAINANLHSKVVGDVRHTVNGAFNLNTVGDNKLTSGANTQIKSGTDTKIDSTRNTSVLSGVVHKETASQIHMNTAAFTAGTSDTADSIGDTFTKSATDQAVDDSDQILDKDGNPIDGLRVTADANRALVAQDASRPRRIPKHEPWEGHENFNPAGHFPSATAAIQSPSPEVRTQSPLLDKDSDIPDYSETSGIYNAQDPYITNAEGQRVKEEFDINKVSSKNTDNSAGNQPADPVPVSDMKRYMLDQLIKGLGLDPATCLQSANPADLPAGATPGNAQALAMALAQVQKECNFEPRSENMNYRVSTLQRVWPNRFGGAAGKRKAEALVAAGPPAIANSVYGNRMGNGGPETGDGFRYRGRGLIQITGTFNYKKYGKLAGVDIYNNPDTANDPEIATKIAVAYLKSKTVTWTDFNFGSLGTQFQKAVGYAGGQANTNDRIGLGKGFYNQIIAGELTPLASLTKTEPIDVGAGKSQVQ